MYLCIVYLQNYGYCRKQAEKRVVKICVFRAQKNSTLNGTEEFGLGRYGGSKEGSFLNIFITMY